MGHFPTGVCIVALENKDGSIAAMTVNSVVSVSLEPLLLCWSLHNSSGRFDLFANASRFSISILEQGQSGKALNYASRGEPEVQTGDFGKSASGLPIVAGALAHFECRSYAQHLAGDHTLLLGEVTGLSTSPAGDAQALTFYKGEFLDAPKS